MRFTFTCFLLCRWDCYCMSKLFEIIFHAFQLLGYNPKKTIQTIKNVKRYRNEYSLLKKQLKYNSDFNRIILNPQLGGRLSESGTAKGHYFHQDLFVSRKIFHNKPLKHVDIGSRIDGFVAHVASFRDIEVIDIRYLTHDVPSIKFIQADMSNDEFSLNNYTDSVSSLHAIEHFGLGRYGDKVDVNGHVTALDNIYSMLKREGRFYFSVPIGPQRIEFNAHRVFSLTYLLNYLQIKYHIHSFSYVDDNGDLHREIELKTSSIENNLNCFYGLGIFDLVKK